MSDERDERGSSPERWSNRRILFLAVAVALIFYAVFMLPPILANVLGRAREILVLLVVSVGLTYFLLPAVDRLCSIPVDLAPGVKRRIAALLSIVVFLGLLVLLITVVVTPIVEETGRTFETVTTWAQEDLAESLQRWLDGIVERLPEEYREQVSAQLETVEEEWTVERIAELVSARIQEWGAGIIQWHVNLFASILAGGHYLIILVIVPVLAYYFLTDATAIREGTAAHVPEGARQRYHQMLEDIDTVIQGYVRTLLVISTIIGAATIIILYVGGVDVYLTFGILAGIANMVPVLGAIVAVTAMAAISLLQVGLQRAVIILLIYGVIEVVSDRIIAPKLMAEGSKLHPVAVILALLVGWEFFGFIGLFVAVPLLAAARVAWLHYRAYMTEGETSREFDRLLGREPSADAEQNADDHHAPKSVVGDDDADADAADDAAMHGDVNRNDDA